MSNPKKRPATVVSRKKYEELESEFKAMREDQDMFQKQVADLFVLISGHCGELIDSFEKAMNAFHVMSRAYSGNHKQLKLAQADLTAAEQQITDYKERDMIHCQEIGRLTRELRSARLDNEEMMGHAMGLVGCFNKAMGGE
jgi:hypothetical protein